MGERRAGSPRTSVEALSVEIVDREAEFLTLEADWRRLVEGAPSSVCQTWEWIRSWWQQFGADHRLAVLVARTETGRVVGIAPLAIRFRRVGRVLPYRELVLLGNDWAEPGHLDLLAELAWRETVARAFTRTLTTGASWDRIRLDRLDAGSAWVAALRVSAPDAVWREHPCRAIALPERWDDLEQQLGRGFRQALNRQHKKLATAGQLDLRRIDDPVGITIGLDQLFAMNQAVRGARQLTSAFTDPRLQAFHQTFAPLAATRGWLRLDGLFLDGEMIAIYYCLRFQQSVTFYNTGYRPDWARFGPGRIALRGVIAASIAEGATEFDLGHGDQPYKAEWSNQIHGLVDFSQVTSSTGRRIERARQAVQRVRAIRARWSGNKESDVAIDQPPG